MTKAPSGKFNAQASANPLINPPKLPYDAPAFDKVKAEHILPAIEWGLSRFQSDIEAIKTNKEAPSFKNTIEALEFAGSDLGRINAVFGTLASNNSNDDIRSIEEKVDALTTPIYSAIGMDSELFARIKAVYDNKENLELDQEQSTLLENTYKARVRSGALLNDAEKARLTEINTELSKLTTGFSQNNTKAVASFKRLAGVDELIGVPERSIKAFQAAAISARKNSVVEWNKAQGGLEALQGLDADNFKSKKARTKAIQEASTKLDEAAENKAFFENMPEGSCLIKLQPYPEEVLTHCENRALREEINKAHAKICEGGRYDNRQIVMDIVKLRQEKARLLGYENHADFVLSERMAGSQKAVEEFLEKNRQDYYQGAKEFFEEVKAYALSTGDIETYEPWDFAFYDRILVEQKYDFDEECLRPYFEVGNVLDGFRSHVEKLFNVEMIDCTDRYPAYRDDAQVFEVKDKENGEVIALFYADYFADAAAKRGGAWMNGFRDAHQDQNGKKVIPIVTNSCNYQKPTEGQPSLLSMRDVETLFHEGGHAFHAILSKGKYSSLNGTNVKWDFVELPSQLMENWVKEPQVLQSFAKDYKTGEPIPAEYIEKIIELGNYDAAYMGLRQTSQGLIDMAWHTTAPQKFEDVEDAVFELTGLFPERTSTMSQRFSHLFSSPVGYSAGYYSYKWAEVLEADVFSEFKREGLYDPATSQRLKDTIFRKGGQIDPMDLFVEMMGRKPDASALLKREGIKVQEKTKPAATIVENNAPDIGQP